MGVYLPNKLLIVIAYTVPYVFLLLELDRGSP